MPPAVLSVLSHGPGCRATLLAQKDTRTQGRRRPLTQFCRARGRIDTRGNLRSRFATLAEPLFRFSGVSFIERFTRATYEREMNSPGESAKSEKRNSRRRIDDSGSDAITYQLNANQRRVDRQEFLP